MNTRSLPGIQCIHLVLYSTDVYEVQSTTVKYVKVIEKEIREILKISYQNRHYAFVGALLLNGIFGVALISIFHTI